MHFGIRPSPLTCNARDELEDVTVIWLAKPLGCTFEPFRNRAANQVHILGIPGLCRAVLRCRKLALRQCRSPITRHQHPTSSLGKMLATAWKRRGHSVHMFADTLRRGPTERYEVYRDTAELDGVRAVLNLDGTENQRRSRRALSDVGRYRPVQVGAICRHSLKRARWHWHGSLTSFASSFLSTPSRVSKRFVKPCQPILDRQDS